MTGAPTETDSSLLQLHETRNEEDADAAPVNDAAAASEAPVKRARGRPQGSKNEPKSGYHAKLDTPALLPAIPVAAMAHLQKVGLAEKLSVEDFRIENLPVEEIHVRGRLRGLDQVKVAAIAESMQEIGLQTPITVYEAENGDIVCIVGAHRVAAAKFLGWSNITCHIVQMTGLARRLWEIDENLCRAKLNELERAEHLAARKEIYEQLHPEARQHASGALAANAAMGRGDATDNLSAASFAADTAAKTGVDMRTVRRSVRRAKKISSEVRDEIREVPAIADCGVELDALANVTPEEQAAAVAAVKSGEAKSVREALGHQMASPSRPPLQFSGYAFCIKVDSLMQRWNDHELAMAISRLLQAAWMAPDAPKAGCIDPAEAAQETIAELSSWVAKLQNVRTYD